MRSVTSTRRAALAAVTALLTSLLPVAFAAAQEGPFPNDVTLTPESDTAPAGTCNEFTARVTGFGEPGPRPISGVTVDVLQTLSMPGNEPAETRELAFCNPQNPTGANPTGAGGTSFGDVSGNNAVETAGQAGRNTTVHGEVGPTDANGEVTFGITMTPASTAGSVTVTAWFDFDEEDDSLGGDEPSDQSTKTWTAIEQPAATSIDAAPEASSNPNGTQHSVTVTVLDDGVPVSGIVPESVITADGAGRPAGDLANDGSGPSPNFSPGKAKGADYDCTASDGNGVSTCTFLDPTSTGAGTDTIVFFVDLGGVADEPDAGDPQDAVQKSWFVQTGGGGQPPPPATPEARNIRLCHGPSPTPQCDTVPHSLEPGDLHTMSVLVTNRSGAPLGGIPVQLRHVGPADFVSTGTDTVLVTTSADGTARATLASEVEGTSTIVAEISPSGTPGGFRGPGAADDECEQPAGAGGAPPAGNCISATLLAFWELHPPTSVDCDDAIDNDGDGFIDFGEDPGCTSEDDGSEEPFNAPVEERRHPRRINMRFRDWVGPGDEGLVIFGRLRLVEDNGLRKCTQQQPVAIQRFVDGEYKTVKTATTNARGRYAGVVFDKPGPYRAVAPRTEIVIEHDDEEQNEEHICLRASKAKTHHHRR